MATSETLRYGTSTARWTIAATVLGSGIAFLDGTVVNVALPAIGSDLDMSLAGLQWTVNAYLVTLSAFVLLGGSLGDRFGRRRVFVTGLVWFTVASILCGLATTAEVLIAARALQGVGAALLVPGSLAIIAASFAPEDRPKAIGAWSGWSGISTAIGPFVGGWLVDAVSWHYVFFINVPLAAVAIAIAVRHVPESSQSVPQPLDLGGAVLVSAALALLSYAAITRDGTAPLVAGILGVIALVAFLAVERAVSHPMLPLRLFRSAQFTGTNLTTLAVYAGLGGVMFFLVIQLQDGLGYSALEAGAAMVPFTLLLLVLSPGAGEVSQRIGPRVPLTVGPIVAGAGILVLSGVSPGDHYTTGVLPGVLVLGLGMAITVAPLTAAVLGSVDDDMSGVASGVNNAVARFAGLVAVAVLPALAGVGVATVGEGFGDGYEVALRIAAAVTAVGGIVAAALVRRAVELETTSPAPLFQPCQDPCVEVPRRAS